MAENLRIGRVGEDGVTFAVPRVLVAIKTVATAAELPVVELPFNDEGAMHYPQVAQLSSDLRDLIAAAMKNEGSLTVRFLGDLKQTIYPLDTQFFHLGQVTEDGGEFGRIIQKSMLETAKQDITFVNLATVRDVKLHVGNHRAIGTTDDLRFLSNFCDALEVWADVSATISVRAV